MNIRRKFVMPHNACIRIILPQLAQQGNQGYFLFHRTGVGRTALLVQASFVAHADAVFVETAGMGTDVVHGAADVGDSIASDVEMIADVGESALLHMAAAEGFYRKAAVRTGGGTMDHYQAYAAIVLVLGTDVVGGHHG